MSEKPILMSTPNVNAILDGRKTMTRRVINPQPKIVHELRTDGILITEQIFRDGGAGIKCPYGQVGGRLWVRETWMPETEQGIPTGGIIYKATNNPEPDGDIPLKWRPSIFMPRWASRITLEITEIRVERLNQISHRDICAEGISENPYNEFTAQPYHYGRDKLLFEQLWDSINAKRGYNWASNPWVWVISFNKLEAQHE